MRLCSVILKLIGWKITGKYPYEEKKMIIAAGPHTSNWDFPLGVLTRCKLRAKVKFVGKATLFRPPLGWIIKPLGGIPVDRSKSNNFVDAVANTFKARQELTVLFAPEGTRNKVDKLKTGFYFVAQKTKIPILPMILDYSTKEIKFLPLFWPGEDAQADIHSIEKLFKGVQGKIPRNGFY